jgi:hypothetical protein
MQSGLATRTDKAERGAARRATSGNFMQDQYDMHYAMRGS